MIREATIDDIAPITEMALLFWQESPFNIPADEETIKRFAEHCLEQNLLCVLELDNVVEGFAAGIKGVMLGDSNVTCGNEVAWWVNPEHRGGKNGIKLLRFLEDMAKNADIRFWTMAFMTSSMPEVVEGIYQKLGYVKTEVSYTKEL